MLNMLMRFCFALLSLYHTPALASDYNEYYQTPAVDMMHIECEPELQPYLKKILKVSDARLLVAKINKEGSIKIAVNRHPLSEQFGAFWDMDNRIICVNLKGNRSEGSIIGSILFELHNAAANSKLMAADERAYKGSIDREAYVRTIEFIEYENSLSASSISKQGIAQGIFPSDAYLHTYRNFEEHYHYQKIGGHSYWIGKNFDEIRKDSLQG